MFWKKKQKNIVLPDDLLNSSFAYVDKVLPDLKPEIKLVVGIPLAYYVVSQVMKKEKPKKETGFLKSYFKQWLETMKFILTGK